MQETLVLSFNAADPSNYHVFIPNPDTNPSRRRMLFRRVTNDRIPTSHDLDPLTHAGVAMKVLRPHADKIKAVPETGLNK